MRKDDMKKDNWQGNMLINNRYQNDEIEKKIPLWNVIKWQLSRNPQKVEKQNDKSNVNVVMSEDFLSNDNDKIVWFGHSTFYIQIGGVKIITDPCFYNILLKKRLVALPCNPELLHVDYILISHNHRDHLCTKSIKTLFSPQTKIVLPLGAHYRIKQYKQNSIEMGWYQEFKAEKISFTFLPASHWTQSNLTDYNKSLWGSFMITSNEKTIYFAGDTGMGTHFSEISTLFPTIDYALLPIGAYSPQWFMQKQHMNPEEAVEAAILLGSPMVIPMHYGTYDLADEPLNEPLKRFKKQCDKTRIRHNSLDIGFEYSIE